MTDVAAIAALTTQLGYDVEAAVVAARLSRILPRQDQHVFVAELAGVPVGWLHAAAAEFVESGAFVIIAGLVVDHSHRRHGIGARLMQHAEAWAGAQGCSVVRLWSSASRTDAHRFYEGLGYAYVKTQFSFVKSLCGGDGDPVTRFVPRVARPS